MSVIRWEDPPAGWTRNATREPRPVEFWPETAAELRERRGEWGLVLEDCSWNSAGGIPGLIKRGALAAFRPAGTFEAQLRTVGQRYNVYARYVGEVS